MGFFKAFGEHDLHIVENKKFDFSKTSERSYGVCEEFGKCDLSMVKNKTSYFSKTNERLYRVLGGLGE